MGAAHRHRSSGKKSIDGDLEANPFASVKPSAHWKNIHPPGKKI
jgi:hypothetical protein